VESGSALILTLVSAALYGASRRITKPCEEMVWVDLSFGFAAVAAVVCWLSVVAWLV
jgi:hypothetical protein